MRRLVFPLAILLSVLGLSFPATAVDERDVLVYTGNGAYSEGYTKFAQAAGRDLFTMGTLPADLSTYACVVLPISNTTFTTTQKSALSTYVTRGGRLLALGEYRGFNDSNDGVVATMNDLASALGSSLSLDYDSLDSHFHVTSHIDPSPYTVGVSQIMYAATSSLATVTVGSGAQSLVRVQDGSASFIGGQPLGSGVFVLSGDSNVWSDASGTAYTDYDNGKLVSNLCGISSHNSAPQVNADSSEVITDEGSAVSNTGTFSDSDNDNVSLSASVGSVVDDGDGAWTWSYTPGDGPGQSQSVTVTADDGTASSQTSFDLVVKNVAPAITALTPGATQVLAGQSVTFTGTASDPSSADTTAGFSWSFNSGVFGPAATYTTSFASCGDQTVTAQAKDKDAGISTESTSSAVTVSDGEFAPPLTAGIYNAVRAGQVVPIKVDLGCAGAPRSGIQPAIQLLSGELDPSTDTGDTTLNVATDSVSSADTSGFMREANGQYIYNLRVPNAKPGALYTVRVRPFGASGGSMYAVLKIRK